MSMAERIDFQYLTGALTGGPRPAAIGRKFDASGAVLPTPGNTTLCHIDQSTDAFAHLVTAQEALRAGPVADAFTFLPPASFHMTIFGGVIEYTRTRPDWPAHLPIEADIDAITQDFDTRLRGLGLARSFSARPTCVFGGYSLRMTGTDAECEATLRKTRDQLRDATGIVTADHDSYAFHITLGYLLRWLSPDEARSVIELSDQVGRDLIARIPSIDLGPVEFCRFDTMHEFIPRHLID